MPEFLKHDNGQAKEEGADRPEEVPGSDLPDSAEKDVSVEELLEQYDSYIVALVRQRVYRTKIGDLPISDLECDEIIQQVRIKFWTMLSQKNVEYPKAYLRMIVHTIMIDKQRARKPPLPLPVDEEGELYAGTVIAQTQEEMENPANEFEQEEAVRELLERTAAAVASLPPRQQRAMIASLAERVDNVLQLVEAFKKYRIDVLTNWPEDKQEHLLLKASLSIARRKIASSLASAQVVHAGTQHAPAVQQYETPPVEEHEPAVLDQCSDSQEQAGMEASLGNLREPYRTAVYLHRVKGRSYQQMVDELHLPLGTVKSHVSRGQEMLRKLREMGPNLWEMSQRRIDSAEIAARAGTLREPYRTPIELHYKQKHSYPQIAGELNLPEGTVKSYISRGVKMLRKSA